MCIITAQVIVRLLSHLDHFANQFVRASWVVLCLRCITHTPLRHCLMRSGCMLHCGTSKKRGDEMPHRYLTDECSVQQRHAKTAIHNWTRPYCPLTGDLLVPIASQVMCSTFWVGSVLTVYKGFQGSNGTKP